MKEIIKKSKKIMVLGIILIASMALLTGCGEKEDNSKKVENKVENQVQNTVAKQEETKTNNVTNNTSSSSSSASTKETASKSDTKKSSKLIVYREGSAEEVPSKEYDSTLGYTIRYDTESFKASHHDGGDWFERDSDGNCVVVEKENVSYSKKISTVTNYKKTTVNGYEAVYTTRAVEGQIETTYYVNTGKESTYTIKTSCQGTTEYQEGLAKIMDAMVQTFILK